MLKRYENDEKPVFRLNELQLRMKQQVEQKVKNGTYQFEEVLCPICSGNTFEFLAEKDRYGLYTPVVICRDCGLIQTNPRMNQTAYNEFYNHEYRELYGGKEAPTPDFFKWQYDKGRRIFEYLESTGLLKGFENKFVLEVGCGAGGILHYFREQGCRVAGIDLGKSYIEYGKNQYGLNLSVDTINTIDLDEAPDLIIYSHVLEHILTPNEELKKVYSILPDTGLLYIEVPSVKNIMKSHEMDLLRLLQNAHVYNFSLKSLTNLLTINGFELVAGNEIINSVFRKMQNGNSSNDIENDYSDVMAYLQKAERLRRLYPISPYRLQRLSKSIVARILEPLS